MKLNILTHGAIQPPAGRLGNCITNGMANVKVFGADWCSMTQRTKEHLQQLGVNYEYVNVERDPRAAAWVRAQNGGKEKSRQSS